MMLQKNYRVIVLGLILSLLIIYYVYREIGSTSIEVNIDRNFIIQSNFNFTYEHWKEEKLLQLREQEDYKDITSDNQFNYFLQLCNWVHQQWEHSNPDPYPLSNAIDILADIRSQKTGGFCGQYSYVLADVLKSLGFFAVRYVELWSNSGESHFVVEVWCDQYEKWVILDPDRNLYYELTAPELPANAYEIRNSLYTNSEVRARNIETRSIIGEDSKKNLYANFAVSLRSDLFRHTKPLSIQDRFDMFLFFKDGSTDETVFKMFNNRLPYRHITTRKEDIYYDCNRVRIEYSISEAANQVFLEFYTDRSMANFKTFALSFDKGKTWKQIYYQIVLTDEFEEYELWVRPLNMFDRPGCITKAHIFFE